MNTPESIQLCRTKKELHWSEILGKGQYVPTVDRDEETVRNYIKDQGEEDKRIDQLDLF